MSNKSKTLLYHLPSLYSKNYQRTIYIILNLLSNIIKMKYQEVQVNPSRYWTSLLASGPCLYGTKVNPLGYWTCLLAEGLWRVKGDEKHKVAHLKLNKNPWVSFWRIIKSRLGDDLYISRMMFLRTFKYPLYSSIFKINRFSWKWDPRYI